MQAHMPRTPTAIKGPRFPKDGSQVRGWSLSVPMMGEAKSVRAPGKYFNNFRMFSADI